MLLPFRPGDLMRAAASVGEPVAVMLMLFRGRDGTCAAIVYEIAMGFCFAPSGRLGGGMYSSQGVALGCHVVAFQARGLGVGGVMNKIRWVVMLLAFRLGELVWAAVAREG